MASITYLEVPFGRNGFIRCRMDMYLQSRKVIRGPFIKDVCKIMGIFDPPLPLVTVILTNAGSKIFEIFESHRHAI